jgi:methylenetetrahydrofolate dehydrogenase (NADP+)/methenyltetrahydrofolate cyclohydrolase
MLPCAVAGILELLDHYKHSDNIPGANIVVVGRSKKLGLPLSLELMQRNATVTTCHSLTPPEDLKRSCRGADYLFVAAGQPHLITKDMVKQGAVVINIGTTYIRKNGKEASLLPDVHPDVASVAKVMSPTPHGVGPLPVAMLCHNTLGLYLLLFLY